jgi:hypothetical protein
MCLLFLQVFKSDYTSSIANIYIQLKDMFNTVEGLTHVVY